MSTSPDPRDRRRSQRARARRRADIERTRDRDQGFRAPGYRSGRMLLKWITGIVGVMVILALALAWVDSRMLNDIDDYGGSGLTDLPGNDAGPGELLAFAADQGLECGSAQNLAAGVGGCRSVLDIARTVNDYKSDQSVVWAFIVGGVIALLIPFTMFVHQASSNLRYLRAEGQRFTPGWAVGWFFIPFMNFVQPFRVVRELMRASGPTETANPRAWQNAGSPSGLLVGVWWASVIAAILFGPRGISVFFARDDIDDWARVGRLLVWSDLFQVVPLVLTVLVMYRVQSAQEIRHHLILDRQSRPAENS